MVDLFTWASMKFFRRLTARKTSLSQPAERLSDLLVYSVVTHIDAICEVGLWEKYYNICGLFI